MRSSYCRRGWPLRKIAREYRPRHPDSDDMTAGLLIALAVGAGDHRPVLCRRFGDQPAARRPVQRNLRGLARDRPPGRRAGADVMGAPVTGGPASVRSKSSDMTGGLCRMLPSKQGRVASPWARSRRSHCHPPLLRSGPKIQSGGTRCLTSSASSRPDRCPPIPRRPNRTSHRRPSQPGSGPRHGRHRARG